MTGDEQLKDFCHFSIRIDKIEPFQINFNAMTMSPQIQPHLAIEKWVHVAVSPPYAALAIITSGCILQTALECRKLLLYEILKIHIAGVTFSKLHAMVSTVGESPFPEIVTDYETVGRGVDKVDVKSLDDVKFVQHAGKGKKAGKKGAKKGSTGKSNEGKRNKEQEKSTQREKEEEERFKRWNEDWEKKLIAQEALDDIPCCSANGLSLKPRTQSNVWIKVTRDKKTQDIQMAFMHVPVPRPKPPPLPKLVKVEPAEVPSPVPGKKKGAKKKGKGKKK